ncbi:MAG TPA: mandelate racemase/muconate lactonizing enzyme family protein [Methylomirabilota bacterium]|jgi:L-alanine-DL-glutamate epimerase-like enolase superfamily enzyme|nr:mandelate racemase/muconate lactonizing enzyme family protein [Methylomirabilota bacterium]
MKITSVRAIPTAVPIRELAPVASSWSARASKQILVEVRTDAGLTGWGEAFAYGVPLAVCTIIEDGLAPIVIGEEAGAIEALVDRMHRALMIWGRRGLAMMAVSGVELALWDLAGKARGVPVYALLGGLVQRSVRAYASLPRYESPADVARAAAAMAEHGFTAIKLHQIDVPSVAAARQAVGDGVELMLDTNCPWSVEDAIAMARRLEPYRLRWLEEPVWPPEDYAGLARVRAATSTSIACGENEATVFGFREIIRAGAADVVQPSVTKVGGLLEMKKIAALAAASNVTLVPHSFYFGPGLAATVHAAASSVGVPYMEFPSGELAPSLSRDPIRCTNGMVRVEDRPGLGADPDLDVIARHPYSREGARPFYLT